MPNISPQNYPRINDTNSHYYGFFDDTEIYAHSTRITDEVMNRFIVEAIHYAEKKSSREIINIPEGATEANKQIIYRREGRKLFSYFKTYFTDPAATAHQLFNRHYREVGIEYFRLQTLQKERMNSGWRYQSLALQCAQATNRFVRVSDLGTQEADFNAIITQIDRSKPAINLYVSIKNRSNTMGGQDWPKAIQALEMVANTDRNRAGPYLCVFGLVMDASRNERLIKKKRIDNLPYSFNTELWFANYFWPFFTNFSYQEVMKFVLNVLIGVAHADNLSTQVDVPNEVLESFGRNCESARLINENGIFNDAQKLVEFFCG